MPLLLIFLLVGCASMGTPGGGPKDEEGPLLLVIDPEPGSTEVDPEGAITLQFNEPVDRKTLISALFISPVQEKDPRIKIRGSVATIKLRDPIPADRTLVVVVGSETRDLRGNKMAESVTFALSSGDRIDQGRIDGQIFSKKRLTRMLVGAWLLADSVVIEPDASNADFLTQSGMKGEFSFEYLPIGIYRIACWDDRDADRKYSVVEDRLGLASSDVVLMQDGKGWMTLNPVKRDTTGVKLLIVSATDNRHVTLRFSKVVPAEIVETVPDLKISGSGGELNILRTWIDAVDSSRIVLFTEPQFADSEYVLQMPLDTTMFLFSGSALPDTTFPRVVASSPINGANDLSVFPSGWIAVGDAFGSFGELTLMVDDTVEISLNIKSTASNLLTWQSFQELEFGAKCKLTYDMADVSDLSGNQAPDSTEFELDFSVVDPAETGSISGILVGDWALPVQLSAMKTIGKTSNSYDVEIESDSDFSIPLLPSGEYRLMAFEDVDRNGIYNYGRIVPFEFAERITVGQDTITVNTRWDTGGVRLERMP